MIDARQLMIGNYLTVDGKYIRVKDIGDDGINIFWYHEMTHYDVLFEDLEPIPLDNEILTKCGFEKKDRSNEYWDFWILDNGWYIGMAHHNEPSAGVEKNSYYWGENYVQIKSLHQLQNLYFALTGEELKIDL